MKMSELVAVLRQSTIWTEMDDRTFEADLEKFYRTVYDNDDQFLLTLYVVDRKFRLCLLNESNKVRFELCKKDDQKWQLNSASDIELVFLTKLVDNTSVINVCSSIIPV